MKFQNPFQSKHWSISKIILILWIIFSVLYIGRDAKNAVLERVFDAGKQIGQESVIVELMGRAQRCEPVNLFAGQGEDRVEINLVNPSCVAAKQTEETEEE